MPRALLLAAVVALALLALSGILLIVWWLPAECSSAGFLATDEVLTAFGLRCVTSAIPPLWIAVGSLPNGLLGAGGGWASEAVGAALLAALLACAWLSEYSWHPRLVALYEDALERLAVVERELAALEGEHREKR